MPWTDQWAGDGLIGSSCTESPNPVINFGQPFGHPHEQDIIDLLTNCYCSIYGEKYTFNVQNIPTPADRICCHELPFIYFRWNADGYHGQMIKEEYIWRKAGREIMHWEWSWEYDDSYPYYHGYMFIGWCPCGYWPGGEWYNPQLNQQWGWPEIYENGDYTHEIKISQVSTGNLITSKTINVSITGLNHTVVYGDITDDWTGVAVEGDIGIQVQESGGYNGICGTFLNNIKYKTKYNDTGYVISCDGLYDIVQLEFHKSGYQALYSVEVIGVTQANLTEFDITMIPSIRGLIQDASNAYVPLANVYVWAENFDNAKSYSALTDANGKYSIPVHYGGTYQVRATKNNYNTISIGTYTQSGEEPTSCVSYTSAIIRISNYPIGEYAMTEDNISINNRATIILDDPTMGTGDLILPASVGTSIIKAKTRNWQSTLGTSSGSGLIGMSAGMGGCGGNGNMGAAEGWDCDWKEPGYIICEIYLCSGVNMNYPPCDWPYGPDELVFPDEIECYNNRLKEDEYYMTLDYCTPFYRFDVHDSAGNWFQIMNVNDTILFNGIERKLIWADNDIYDGEAPFCPFSYIYAQVQLEWREPR